MILLFLVGVKFEIGRLSKQAGGIANRMFGASEMFGAREMFNAGEMLDQPIDQTTSCANLSWSGSTSIDSCRNAWSA